MVPRKAFYRLYQGSVATAAMLGVLELPPLSRWANAADPLPYSTRTLPYSGLGTGVRGDIRTVGMAGAAVGLGDSFIAAQTNPAGLAMTLFNADLKINTNRVQDYALQGDATPTLSLNAGLAWAPYPWGFSIGVITPHNEGKEYSQGLAANTVREVRFSLARNFFSNHLSLGASGVFGQNETILGNRGYATFAPGIGAGMQVQIPVRVLLGLSFSSPMSYPGAPSEDSGAVTSFFRGTQVPWRVSGGVGWIPNRFFRLGASLNAFGPLQGAALLRSETQLLSDVWTFQPHLGLSYLWIDFKEFRSLFSTGTYLENTRIQSEPVRPHWTAGLEVVAWVVIVAVGVDVAPRYNNLLFGVGVDVLRLFEKLDLVPERHFPARGGIFPNVARLSDEGLARPLVKNWVPQGPQIDPFAAGMQLPSRLGEKAKELGRDLIKTVQ